MTGRPTGGPACAAAADHPVLAHRGAGALPAIPDLAPAPTQGQGPHYTMTNFATSNLVSQSNASSMHASRVSLMLRWSAAEPCCFQAESLRNACSRHKLASDTVAALVHFWIPEGQLQCLAMSATHAEPASCRQEDICRAVLAS